MRIVLGGNQRHAEAYVYDKNERAPVGKAGDSRADESVSDRERPDHGRFLELSGKEKDQEVQTAVTRCTGWHLANATRRYRSRPGISKVHRVFPLPGRVSRAARSLLARPIHRAALFDSCRRARDASARHGKSH